MLVHLNPMCALQIMPDPCEAFIQYFCFGVMLFSLEEGLVQVTYMVWFSFNSVQWT